jgi:hypothetical protein
MNTFGSKRVGFESLSAQNAALPSRSVRHAANGWSGARGVCGIPTTKIPRTLTIFVDVIHRCSFLPLVSTRRPRQVRRRILVKRNR